MYMAGGILIFIIVFPFMEKVSHSNDVQATLIATGLSLGGVYFGTYISQVIIITRKSVPTWVLILLSVVLVVLVSWIFIIGQHPINGKSALNMLFFGLPFVVASVVAGLLIRLVRSTVESTLHEARTNAAQSRSELSLLQSQLSPHFLFNTLNNMYGISIAQHEKIPALLLKLSELLRYSLYDARDQFVAIGNEIAYLNNYIEFEKIRIGDRLNLRTAIEQFVDDRLKIAPMLLIVFVENAFKHSKNTIDEKVFVDMEIKTWGSFLQFSIKNSGVVPDEVRMRFSGNSYNPLATASTARRSDMQQLHINPNEEDIILQSKDASRRTGGLGLLNVQKRLELLYPGAYDLRIEARENEFVVMLQLKMQQHNA
jgi:LytS/YehU family sensor histidine kinase